MTMPPTDPTVKPPSTRADRFADDDMLAELERVLLSIGYRPTLREWPRHARRFNPGTYILHFGSWNKAWERLVETKSRCPATSVAQASIIAELANRRCRANAKSWQRQIAVRLPAHSYDQLKQFAAKKGSAMQTLLAEAVEGYLAQLAGNTSGPRAAID